MEHRYRSSRADLEVTLTVGPDLARVVLAGELDLTSAGRLRPVVPRVLLTQVPEVLVELHQLGFCDVCGVEELVVAHRRWSTNRQRVHLTGATPQVRRIFAMTGHGHLLASQAADTC